MKMVMAIMFRGQNSTAPNIHNYIPHLFSCSQKAWDPDPHRSGITKQVGELFGWLISKHSDRELLPLCACLFRGWCLPSTMPSQGSRAPTTFLPSPGFTQKLSHTNTWCHLEVYIGMSSDYILLHGVHCAANVGAIFTPDVASFCFFDKNSTSTSPVKTLICRSDNF